MLKKDLIEENAKLKRELRNLKESGNSDLKEKLSEISRILDLAGDYTWSFGTPTSASYVPSLPDICAEIGRLQGRVQETSDKFRVQELESKISDLKNNTNQND